MRNATLIYNPIAGRRPARREREVRQAATVLERAGIAIQLAATTGPGVARHLAATAAKQGDELVVVCGGDGTINEVVNALAFTTTRLAILPGGTANIIARELGLPLNPVRAARQLPRWLPRLVPLGLATWSLKTGVGSSESGIAEKPLKTGVGSGESGIAEKLRVGAPDLRSFFPDSRPPTPDSRLHEAHRYFLSVGGVGYDAHVVYKLTHDFKMFLGVAAYGLEALRQVTRYDFPLFVCRANGCELQGTFAAIQRTSRYAGWFRMAPQARFFEPRLALCLFQSRRWTSYFAYAGAVAGRLHPRLRDVEMLETAQVECSAVEPNTRILFEVDGELAGALPATFGVAPDALTLLTPA